MAFYAYVFRDPSRDNEEIYVGKGKDGRFRRHFKRTDAHPFTHRLKAMKQAGVEPTIEIIHAIDEEHAFFLEECLISIFGRKDLGKGTLLNLTDGGPGNAKNLNSPGKRKSASDSAETKVRRSAAQKLAWSNPESRAKRMLTAGSKEVRERRTASIKQTMVGQEFRAERSAKLKIALNRPDVKAKLSASGKKAWADKHKRAAIMAARVGE